MWIKAKFSLDFEIKCDEMITKPRIILQRLDTHSLLKDHTERGQDIFHFSYVILDHYGLIVFVKVIMRKTFAC